MNHPYFTGHPLHEYKHEIEKQKVSEVMSGMGKLVRRGSFSGI